MLKEMWSNVVAWVKHLFAKKVTSVEILELVKRVDELEAVNKRNEEYRLKNKNRKYNKKTN